ncbi:roadblock/LC7 domain-containing protein [Nocardia arthritidis]|uniref:Roadblock/LAMTOR2 domain-containing protein n=1 Tax=Nocardia arthritidis TaxID=228602 RepID=A0A6G9YLK1_9NOCA|nr:roadblock/LC7 domain-containing protein [Nocardia arthritidis]QIS14061.1 hypothetical protein F5544_31095 [Nocardia arthritidis]
MNSTVRDLDWLLTKFVAEVPSVRHAAVVSADGLITAASADLPTEQADRLAAVTAGLASLATGVSNLFGGGVVQQSIIEMQYGYLLLMSAGSGAFLATLTTGGSDIGQVGYDMALLVDSVGTALQVTERSRSAGG